MRDVPGALPQLASVPVSICPASSSVSLSLLTPWGARQCASSAGRAWEHCSFLPPAWWSSIWQESQAVFQMAKPAIPAAFSLTPRSQALPSLVAVLAPLASSEAIQLPKVPERFPPTPLAGVAFCRFSELCHPVKGASYPRAGWEKALWAALLVGMSWWQLQERLSSGIPENWLRSLTSFSFREEVQWLICKISLCTALHRSWCSQKVANVGTLHPRKVLANTTQLFFAS